MATGIRCIRTGWGVGLGVYDISTDLLLVLCIGNGVQGLVTKMAGNTFGIKPGFLFVTGCLRSPSDADFSTAFSYSLLLFPDHGCPVGSRTNQDGTGAKPGCHREPCECAITGTIGGSFGRFRVSLLGG